VTDHQDSETSRSHQIEDRVPPPPPLPETVDVMPTKEFFIDTLVKDIDLGSTIADLVDNSVDGATRLRGKGSFEGLTVRIVLSPERFRISDDCGGIPLDVARQYAFRLGRPPKREPTPGSIGQFGVGMKRALFKMGRRFSVESKTQNTSFSLDVDVEDWTKNDEWTFALNDPKTYAAPLSATDTGTTIEITHLFDYVAEAFVLAAWRSRLTEDLRHKNEQAIERGLAITLNTIPLDIDPPTILQSGILAPAYREARYEKNHRAPVDVKIYAGVGASTREEAGWNVYCNGRLVLRADKSSLTGWGENGERTIPLYHGEFARFRGYAFCESDDAARLPWNTTKTGIAADSDVYRALRLDMVDVMRPVIDFLNRLSRETDEGGPATTSIAAARAVPLTQVARTERVFTADLPRPKPPGPRTASIQYSKPIADIERVKKALGVITNREVGELTFDFYSDNVESYPNDEGGD